MHERSRRTKVRASRGSLGRRGRVGIIASLAMCAGALVSVTAPAQAAQATGDDVPVWSAGWNWTYATTFNYDDGNGTTATINENVTYTNQGPATFQGQDAYKVSLSGSVTGGSGKASGQNLTIKSGSVSGTEYVRRSDLALLQQQQTQHVSGCAGPGCFVGVTADVNLTLTPSPSWRQHDFPLNPGDSWTTSENVAYTGGFSYDAGTLGGSGSSPFDGTFPLSGASHVSSATISAGGNGSLATDYVGTQSADGHTVDNLWWSPSFKNDAREHLVLPLSGATLTQDRTLTSASTPTPSTTLSEAITPSLTCAGGSVTVSGKLSSGASGVPISVTLDKSQVAAGQTVTAATTTTSGGNYTATLAAPATSDGLGKNGSRANWGVLVSAAGATGAATLVVSPQDCTALVYTGAVSAPQGTGATVSAQLTDLAGAAAAAGKTITFSLSGGASVNATTDSSGVATATLPVAAPTRGATLTASFAATPTMEAASVTTPFAVGVVPTSTTVTTSVPSATQGDAVTFTADVASQLAGNPAGVPTGSVQFAVDGSDFGSPVALSGGSATSAGFTTNVLGDHTVTATYLGDANFGGSTSPAVTYKVHVPLLTSTTTETVSPTSSVSGQSVTLSANVAGSGSGGTPTGTVEFRSGTTTLASAALDASGHASVVTTTLPVGTLNVVAIYVGDDAYNGSSSAPTVSTVAKDDAAVQLSSSKTTSVSGESVNFNAVVTAAAPGSGTPSGTVQLTVDGAPVGSPVTLVGGVADFGSVTSLLTGHHTVGAAYGGDSSFNAGSDSVSQVVTSADTTTVVTSSASPAHEGQPVTLTASVGAVAPGSGEPTGTVTFTSGTDTLGAASLQDVGGTAQASIVLTDLAPGDYTVATSYSGDNNYNASDAQPFSQTVLEGALIVDTNTVLTSSANPSTYGSLISYTATVTATDGSTPTGVVQFSVDGTNLGDPVPVDANGVAQSATIGSPDPGDHTVIAVFQTNDNYSSSGDSLTQTVADAGVGIDLSSSAVHSDQGQAVTFTADVSSLAQGTGQPTGAVQFRVDGQALGDAVALDNGGSATSPSIANLTPGDHTVTATYSGDIHFVSGLASLTQNVAKVGTTTTLVATPSSVDYGNTVTLSATVNPGNNNLGAPTGTVKFVDGGTTLGTVTLSPSGNNGNASLAVSSLGAGTHSITAVYSGSPSFEATSSTPVTVTVAQQVTSMQADPAVVKLLPLGLPLGQLRITLTSGLGPVVGASVEFKVGPKSVCTVNTDANGVAICDARSDLLGLVLFNGYKAYYQGDANYQATEGRGVNLK